jgi:CDP-diacylglycerol--serine O-phosphatidyltransferase
MNYLANALSIASLFCGFVSIIFCLEGHFTFAAWAIIISVVFDGLDGQAARLNPVPSEFGKELDSLVDVVSFGIAPAILGYVFIYKQFYLWAVFALLIYLICSVVRLAKYNITVKEEMKEFFYGLPTTVSGGILASFILIFRKKDLVGLPGFVRGLFLITVLVLAFLMVSRIRYLNLDGLKRIFGRNIVIVLFVLSAVLIVAAIFHKAGSTLFVIFSVYLLFSPFLARKFV